MIEPRTRRSVTLSPAVTTAAGLGSPALAAVASWSSLLLVVRGRVVPGWGVSAALLVMSLVLRWALTRVGRRAGAPELPSEHATWVRLGSGLLIAAALLGTGWSAVDDLISGAAYHVLRPERPGGCTAVVRETSFLASTGARAPTTH